MENSSTSDSSQRTERYIEWRVVACVLLALLVLEMGLRRIEPGISEDLRHINEFPATAEKLGKHEGQKLLIIGNSLTHAGVDVPVLRKALQEAFPAMDVAAVTPDGSNVHEWYYILKKYFYDADIIPDHLLIITGKSHLRDQLRTRIPRMAHYYVTPSEYKGFAKNYLTSIDERSEFLVAAASSLYTNRDRIANRVLTLAIPGYQDITQHINFTRIGRKEAARQSGGNDADTNVSPAAQMGAVDSAPLSIETSDCLKRLLEEARQHGVDVIVATMKLPDDYDLNASHLQAIADGGGHYIENHRISGIRQENFFDGLHLDEQGQAVYTQALIPKLIAELQRTKSDR